MKAMAVRVPDPSLAHEHCVAGFHANLFDVARSRDVAFWHKSEVRHRALVGPNTAG
jgi:hypothetical protein